MKRCYDCGKFLTEKIKSKEHIINNSIGGRLKSYNLLCKPCNSNFGSSMDTAISKSFNLLANQLNIVRDHGSVQDELAELKSGEKILMSPGGKPKLHRTVVDQKEADGKIEISISAPNEKEALKALKGMQRKYKFSDEKMEELRSQLVMQNYPINEDVKMGFQIGGDDLFKALAKMGINYFIFCGGEPKYIKTVLENIKSKEKCDYVWFFNDPSKSFEYSEKQICHSIHVKGCPEDRILYYVVDLFSVAQYIVILNSQYDGPLINNSYSYDLLNQEVVMKNYQHDLNRDYLIELVKAREYDYESLIFKMKRFGHISQNRNYMNAKIERIVDDYFEKYKDTDYVNNPEMFASYFSHYVANEFLPEIQAASETRRKSIK